MNLHCICKTFRYLILCNIHPYIDSDEWGKSETKTGFWKFDQGFSSLFLSNFWHIWWFFKVECANASAKLALNPFSGWFLVPVNPISGTQAITTYWNGNIFRQVLWKLFYFLVIVKKQSQLLLRVCSEKNYIHVVRQKYGYPKSNFWVPGNSQKNWLFKASWTKLFFIFCIVQLDVIPFLHDIWVPKNHILLPIPPLVPTIPRTRKFKKFMYHSNIRWFSKFLEK